jgi:hypothetical protein
MMTIYVRLLDEGTDVFRPTQFEVLQDGLFRILPTPEYDPDDEVWEFAPGCIVRGVTKELDGEVVLVAVSVNYDGGNNEQSV